MSKQEPNEGADTVPVVCVADLEFKDDKLVEAEGWIMLAGAVATGKSHLATGEPVQDRAIWRRIGESAFVLVVADGAGSAKYGGEGAEIAVAAISEFLAEREADLAKENALSLITQAIECARQRVIQESIENGSVPRQFATTLCALCGGKNWLAAAQIGDGLVVLRDGEGGVVPLLVPPRGEFINEVVFLTADEAMQEVQRGAHESTWTEVSVQSDGLQWVTMNLASRAIFKPFYEGVYDQAAQAKSGAAFSDDLAALLNDERIVRKCDDDLTFVCASIRLSGET